MNDLIKASKMLQIFRGESLSDTVAQLEKSFIGATKTGVAPLLSNRSISDDLMQAALIVKHTASQIDEIIHTLGILLALPSILEPGEVVESLSLAAGNTGKGFDVETSKRIAQFTFIEWQGGPEVIWQNKVFKDFYFLAETETAKLRDLYVIGTDQVTKFLNSGRSVSPILAGNAKLGNSFRERYGDRFKVVSEYYQAKKGVVAIKDVRPHLPMQTRLFLMSAS